MDTYYPEQLKFLQGESFTFEVQIESATVENIFFESIDRHQIWDGLSFELESTGNYFCRLPASTTANLLGHYKLRLVVVDSNLGIKKSGVIQVQVIEANNILIGDDVNSSSDVVITLSNPPSLAVEISILGVLNDIATNAFAFVQGVSFSLLVLTGDLDIEEVWLEPINKCYQVREYIEATFLEKGVYRIEISPRITAYLPTRLDARIGIKSSTAGIKKSNLFTLKAQPSSSRIIDDTTNSGVDGVIHLTALEQRIELSTEVVGFLRGEQGIQGVQGVQGIQGLSAYEVAVVNGFNGSIEQWLASLPNLLLWNSYDW